MRDYPGSNIDAPCSFAVNGHGYICAGRNSSSNYVNEVWEYYPTIDTWANKTNFPGLAQLAPISIVYKGYAYMGFGGSPQGNDFWRYEPISDTWMSMDSFPTDGRIFVSLLKIDSFCYALGGRDVQQNYLFYRDVWRYDISRNKWDSVGLMPNPIREGSVFWSFDSVILGGGGVTSDNTYTYDYLIGDFYTHRINSTIWDTLICNNFLDSVAFAPTFVLGKTGYIFGGNKKFMSSFTFSNDVYSFDATALLARKEVGIADVSSDISLRLYPNPLTSDQIIKVETTEAGEILFHDILGQEILHTSLHSGETEIKLSSSSDILFYTVVYHDGRTATGRLLVW